VEVEVEVEVESVNRRRVRWYGVMGDVSVVMTFEGD
jgi:hypothetical protein